MSKKLKSLVTCHWSLVAILIIASFLRLYNLAGLPPGLYPDEAMNGNNALEAWENKDWKMFYPENFGREGLFINIQHIFAAALGNHSWALRLPSAIFGILTVLGLYFLAKELFKNKNLALLAAFLLAVSFWHVNFSRIGFRAIMAPFFLTWASYFLIKAVYANRYALFSVLGGLIYGLGFHSYIAYRATPLLLLIAAVYLFLNVSRRQKLRIFKIFAFFSVGAILTALPLGLYFLKNPADFFGRAAQISILSSPAPLKTLGLNALKTLGMFNIAGDFNWRHNVAGAPLLFWPAGILFLIGVFLAFRNLTSQIFRKSDLPRGSTSQIVRKSDLPNIEKDNTRRSDFQKLNAKILHFAFLILISWLVIAALPVIVSGEGLPHALRSILMAPPVFVLAALGGLWLYKILEPKLNRYLLLVICYLFLSLFVFEAYYAYFVRWGENPNVKVAFNYNDAVIARQLNELPKETPKYVVLESVSGEIKRDNPIFLQPILFLTDTFTDEKRAEKNFFYIAKEEFEALKLPENAKVFKL